MKNKNVTILASNETSTPPPPLAGDSNIKWTGVLVRKFTKKP